MEFRFGLEDRLMKTILMTIGTVALALSGAAHAALITSSPGGTTVVDFSQFDGAFDFTAGPVQVGDLVGEDIVWSSTSSNSVIGNGAYGLGDNGSWDSGRNGYVGLNNTFAPGDYIQFDFNDGPVSVVGGFVNYCILADASQCDPAQDFIIEGIHADIQGAASEKQYSAAMKGWELLSKHWGLEDRLKVNQTVQNAASVAGMSEAELVALLPRPSNLELLEEAIAAEKADSATNGKNCSH